MKSALTGSGAFSAILGSAGTRLCKWRRTTDAMVMPKAITSTNMSAEVIVRCNPAKWDKRSKHMA